MTMLTVKNAYPLSEKKPEIIKTLSGKKLCDINLDGIQRGAIVFDDGRVHPDTLLYQAEIAESVGLVQIANNLRRAAELVRLSDEQVLNIYNLLRPGRSTRTELEKVVQDLKSNYQALCVAKFIEEAIEIMENSGCFKK